MLRIKEEKWEEFCEYAEGVGFEKTNSNDDVIYYLFNNNDNLIFKDRTIEMRDSNILYDLITQGYVEKI